LRLNNFFFTLEQATIKKLNQIYGYTRGNIGYGALNMHFDAQTFVNEKPVFFEIKIFRHKMLGTTIDRTVNQFENSLKKYQNHTGIEATGIIVIVSDFEKIGKEYKSYLSIKFNSLFENAHSPLSLLLIDISELEL
jgi:hypothetical protein